MNVKVNDKLQGRVINPQFVTGHIYRVTSVENRETKFRFGRNDAQVHLELIELGSVIDITLSPGYTASEDLSKVKSGINPGMVHEVVSEHELDLLFEKI